MKTSRFYHILLVCLSIGIAGFVNAKQEQRPYHLQKQALKKNKYYYYPRQNVYFDPVHRVYFVWEKTYWRSVPTLPQRYVSVTYSSSPRFALWMTSAHPYYYNTEHRKTYYEYRVFKPVPPPAPRVRMESRPRPNVSFSIEINPEPRPVYVEERVIVREHRHGHGHGHSHGHGRGHGKGHKHHH